MLREQINPVIFKLLLPERVHEYCRERFVKGPFDKDKDKERKTQLSYITISVALCLAEATSHRWLFK
jgi:hypothetical protein